MISEDHNVNIILPAKSDIYNGMTVDTKELALSDVEFEKALRATLDNWIANGIRGVWFKVNLENSSYIPILIKHGFTFHHAKTSYAMLTRWLPADQPNLLPQYPHTYIAVSGMVINDKRQVLAIQEKYSRKPCWKLPGGASDPGEDFSDTAKRKVFEETGIETEFLSIIALCHRLKYYLQCEQLYVVCQLKPINQKIQASVHEVSKCEWMDIETYRNHPDVFVFDKHIMNAFLENKQMKCSIKATSVLSSVRNDYDKVYTVQSLEEPDKS